MSAPGQPLHDAAGAACRNASIELAELAEKIRRTCLHAFSEPADVPVETVLALHDIDSAARLLGEAADIYYKGPDIETIEAMRRVRERAAADAAERERRKRNDN